MKTSYYAITPDTDPGAISISLYPPRDTHYLHYPALCPSRNLLADYKRGWCDERRYTQIFEAHLAKLDPLIVWNVLHQMTNGEEPILLCYERAGSFCHRRIVAKWFSRSLDIEVPEVSLLNQPHEQLSLFGGAQ